MDRVCCSSVCLLHYCITLSPLTSVNTFTAYRYVTPRHILQFSLRAEKTYASMSPSIKDSYVALLTQ